MHTISSDPYIPRVISEFEMKRFELSLTKCVLMCSVPAPTEGVKTEGNCQTRSSQRPCGSAAANCRMSCEVQQLLRKTSGDEGRPWGRR